MAATVSVETRKQLIKNQKIFSQLTDEETDEFASLLEEKNFSKGQLIVKLGDAVDSFFFIVQGEAGVMPPPSSDSSVSPIAILDAGKAIGLSETGFYSLTGLRTATVVAQTDVVSLYMSIPRFNGFALSHSHVGQLMRKNAEN